MLQHADVWRAIDRLAAKYGLSPSGLAKRSGLDPTTFNKSKRIAKDGKLRWPSTESLAKILAATGASLQEFVGLIANEESARSRGGLRRIGYNVLSEPGFFDANGRPIGNGWAYMSEPELSDPDAFAIEIRGQGLLPAYADGHILIASPAAPVEPGHRVILRIRDGSVVLGTLARRGMGELELVSFDRSATPLVIPFEDVSWVSRILWAMH